MEGGVSLSRNGSPVGESLEVFVSFAKEIGLFQGSSLISVSLKRGHVSLCERNSSVALNSRGHHIQIGVSPSLSQKRDIDDGSLFPAELRGEDSSDPLDPKKTILGTVGVSLQLIRSVKESVVALVAISGDAGSARNADETIAVIARNVDTNHPSADLVDSALSDAFPSQNREGDIADSGLPKKVSCRADADFSYLDISEISRCIAGAGSIGIEDAGNIGNREVVLQIFILLRRDRQ